MSKFFTHEIRVRYGETDKMGFVYYGNYALYLEEARTELIRRAGFSYKTLEENGLELPVVNLNIQYKKAAHYDDVLELKTCIKGVLSKKICFYTEIYSEEPRELIVKAEVELVFVDTKRKKLISCPSYLHEKLEKYQCK